MDGEEDVDTAEEAWTGANGDSPSFFWEPSTQSALKRLALQPIVNASTGELTATPLFTSGLGQQLMHYVVMCALPAGKTYSNSAYGVSYDGGAALALDWQKAPLTDEKQQRWLTACLLQTLNGIGVHVPIHMVGSNPGLADDPAVDVSMFSIPDGIMFGNIFAPTPEAYACVSEAVIRACGGGSWSTYSHQRICDSSPTCGIQLLGACDRHCTTDKEGNPSCVAPSGSGYAEAIATTLDANGFQTMYRSCGVP